MSPIVIRFSSVHRKLASVATALALVLVLTPGVSRAQKDVWPDPIVQETAFVIPMWISPFLASQSLVTRTQQLQTIIYTDLDFTGLFRIVRGKPTAVGMDRAELSVEVHGKVTYEGSEPFFEGWVTDVASGDYMGGKKYPLDDKSVRRVAHHFADEVVRLVTGESGVASTRIVFTRRIEKSWELLICDYDGYNPRVLVRQGVPMLNPRWADGNRAIIYSSYREGKPDLYIRYLSEGKSETLANFPGTNYAVDWSNRQRSLLAALTKDGNSEIYILGLGGAVERRLTHNRAIDTSPCWAPAGREVVFLSDRSGSPQVYVMARDGSNVRRLTFTGGYNASPAWSPRGDLIAFVARMGNEFQIATITPDGRDGRLVTKDSRSHEDPRWAPDGRHIVYSERSGGDEVISVIDIVTGGKRILAQGTNPDWSTH